MPDFATPVYAQDETEQALSDQVTVDLNDPSLLEESLEFDPTVNPYDMPPPPPDGRYKVKLKQIDTKGTDGQPALFKIDQEKDYSTPGTAKPVFLSNGKPKLFLSAALEASIIDPSGKFDGVKLFDRFMDSRTNRQGGVPMIHLLRCLGTPVPNNVNLATLRELFKKALALEPECEVESTWVGNISQDDSEHYKDRGEKAPKRVRGMHRFPEKDGKRLTEVEVEGRLGKMVQTAQATITNYYPKGSK